MKTFLFLRRMPNSVCSTLNRFEEKSFIRKNDQNRHRQIFDKKSTKTFDRSVQIDAKQIAETLRSVADQIDRRHRSQVKIRMKKEKIFLKTFSFRKFSRFLEFLYVFIFFTVYRTKIIVYSSFNSSFCSP